ncbi:hypothetical protein [Agrococcus sp. ARC_14]|uniref:hypothetical protein n=1 Tax=Agrococcus sp. ARC_14 TaxID=2919927 RepID=UPI001F054565|nr:hypothetical protein [Agrococcus sp. ARC_14]MCH1883577.1 hypothetical protein [Agrococcus sp. ARC_14]
MARASELIDEDPQLAHQHALAAARRAGRIGVVRETLAITAYQLGDFSLALRELRTYRRITGRDDQLPLMADCERGLGRPEKALELARSVEASTLDTAVRVELAIVKSGARLDLGQTDAALEELRIPELRKDKAFEYSPALFASFAGVLEELGRDEEAAEWFALADRAIDALEDALAPGELESVGIVSERLETEDAPEDVGVALEPADGDAADSDADAPSDGVAPIVEPEDVPESDDAVEAPDAIELVEPDDVPEAEGTQAEVTPADDSMVASEDVPEAAVDPVEVAPAGEPMVASEDVPEAATDPVEAAPAGEPVVEAEDVPEADDAAAERVAPAAQDDALFGDALFGDELIAADDTADDTSGEARPESASGDGDAR